jgi:hypothetical protein
MFISWSKGQLVDESSCLMIASRDGRTAYAEHWRQQQRYKYVLYVPTHAPCPWFAMSAMFTAMAAEVWQVLISTSSYQVFCGLYFISQALNLLLGCGLLHAT